MENNKMDGYKAVAVKIQDASNIVAVTGELRDAMIDARAAGIDPRTNNAVMAIFFKLYDMMGAPSVTQMNDALRACEPEEWHK